MAPQLAAVDVTPISRALGDEVRLRIVALLAHGELRVRHLEAALGLRQPNASRRLGLPRRSCSRSTACSTGHRCFLHVGAGARQPPVEVVQPR